MADRNSRATIFLNRIFIIQDIRTPSEKKKAAAYATGRDKGGAAAAEEREAEVNLASSLSLLFP